jgi:hypothetical protein
MYHENGWQMALLPVRIFFQGEDGNPRYFDGKLNPFLLFFPIVVFYGIKHESSPIKREKMILLVFTVLFFLFAFFNSDLRIRYIAPMVPPLILLSVFGIRRCFEIVNNLENRLKKTAVILLLIVTLSPLVYNGDYILNQFSYFDPFPYLRGKISRDAYIAKYLPEYPAVLFINKSVSSNALIMFIFVGSRGYYCDRNYVFGEQLLKDVFLKPGHEKAIQAKLAEMKVTHLLVNLHLFNQWFHDNIPPEKMKPVTFFFDHYSQLLFIENGFGVFVVNPPS